MCLAHPAHPQGAIQVLPGGAEPGRRETPTPSLPDPSAELELKIELPAGVKPPAALLQKTFDLQEIVLEGVTVYVEEDLAGLYRPLLGKTVTFGQFYAVAEAIQARYHLDGYFLSFAYVPPQTVRNGVFRIAVVEGFIDGVNVIGGDETLQKIVTQTLQPIFGIRPLQLAPLERGLLVAGQIAGITVTGVLQRSETTPGASELVVQIEHVRATAQLGINNRGSEFTRPWRYSADATLNAVSPLVEQVSANVTVAHQVKELRAGSLVLSQRIGLDGMRFTAGFGITRSRPGFTLEQFDTKTESVTCRPGTRLPRSTATS